jgi:hypothetical protein
VYRRYFLLLGADRRRPTERRAYDALRASLAEGNLAVRLYSERLTRFLDWIDHFFGDAGKADQTLFPHAFGLRTPAPLWTAPAFDRCLLLALIYPIATIFVIWAASGHVGPAEAALRLKPDLPGWQRGIAAAGLGCWLFLWGLRRREWKARLWRVIAAAVGSAVAVVVLRGTGIIVSIAIGGFMFGRLAVSGTGSVVYAVYLSLILLSMRMTGSIAMALALLFAGTVVFIAVVSLNDIAVKHRWQGAFLSLFLAAMILSCLGAASLLSPLKTWEQTGPMVLFLGLLTLLNALFDWTSLGLARALLRRGLELGGWWP